MTQNYKVGDKVRILDASKIGFGVDYWSNGDVTEVLRVDSDGDPYLKTPVSNSRGLVIIRSEYKYIEKVAEDVTKFKVGDKVRIISTEGQPLAGFEGGDIVSINDAYKKGDGEQRYEVIRSDGTVGFGGNDTFEKVSDKPTKNQRISALESEVEALKAEVAALKEASKPSEVTIAKQMAEQLAKHIGKPNANEQRKAIIAEAKAFVAEQITDGGMRVGDVVLGTYGHLTVNFYVNPEKRTVVFVGKNAYAGNHTQRGTAKCAPDDVFNADIGKAIALGRALGLDVSKFEQAVKPTEVVVGQVVEDLHGPFASGKVNAVKPRGFLDADKGYTVEDGGWGYLAETQILDDTEAQY